jgi:hypothetical protein
MVTIFQQQVNMILHFALQIIMLIQGNKLDSNAMGGITYT